MKNSPRSGFTIIEILVAITVFSILVAIATGGFVSALHTQRQVAQLLASESNVSLAIEQMAREVRTGYLFCHDATSTLPNANCASAPNFGCTVNAATGVWTCQNILDFYNANSQHVDYRFVGGGLQKSTDGGATFQTITGSNVSVKYLTFILFGNTEGDHWPPRITIAIGIAPSSTDPALANTTLNLQTSISARAIDCDTSATPAQC